MTNPDQPTVGDLTARLEFRYENDPLDFLKTGKGYLVVDDKVATIPLPTGEKGEKGDTGRLAEGDVRYFSHRTEEAEAAAEASSASAGRAKTSETNAKSSETKAKTSEANAKSSETKAKASETKAKTSETNAKSSEEAAKTSETNAKSSETNAKASEEESASQAELSTEAAAIASLSAIAFDQLVGEGSPRGKVSAPVGSIYTDRLATNGAIRWIKTSGTGTAGWAVEYGDTGWRDVTNLYYENQELIGSVLTFGEGGGMRMRRIGSDVYLQVLGQLDISRGWSNVLPSTYGWRGPGGAYSYTTGPNMSKVAQSSSWIRLEFAQDSGRVISSGREFNYRWLTHENWPTTLPGTPL